MDFVVAHQDLSCRPDGQSATRDCKKAERRDSVRTDDEFE